MEDEVLFLIRLDDACEYMDVPKWDQMEALLDKYGVKPIVGVIPACEDSKMKGVYPPDSGFWNKVNRWKEKGWTIALHGYHHLYSSNEVGINPVNDRSEFAGLSLKKQRSMIKEGIAIFHSHGIYPEVFFAPAHTFDDNTLTALREESDIRVISDTVASDVYKKDDFWFVPVQSGKARALPVKTATFCYHPNSMKDKDFDELETYLKKKSSKTIVTLKKPLPQRKFSFYDRFLRFSYFFSRRIRKLTPKVMTDVLIIVPNFHLGGAQRTAIKTAELLLDDGLKVTLAVFDLNNAVYESEAAVLNLDLPASDGKIKKVFHAVKRSRIIRKIKKERQVKTCISFGPTANLSNVLSGGKSRVITNFRGFASANGSFLSKYQYRHSDVIVCCSKEIKQHIDSILPSVSDRTVVIYNPFDLDLIAKMGDELVDDYVFSKQTIVTHGRLNSVKNHYRLIKAFSLVHRMDPNTQLLIIGEGEMRDELQSLIDSLELTDNVKMIGFRKNPFKYLSKSTLFVLSSFSEGFPNALVEGMAFLPAVSVDCPSGPREILGGGDLTHTDSIEEAEYGILVKPAASKINTSDITDDDRLLAQAIGGILSNSKKMDFYRKKAVERVSKFSFDKYRDDLTVIMLM
ncbi:MAG: DUF2334 domain-containing protein [Clostridia bacterium]|nr:DUF2334 domain-containing protein [Clostridia bacterium]